MITLRIASFELMKFHFILYVIATSPVRFRPYRSWLKLRFMQPIDSRSGVVLGQKLGDTQNAPLTGGELSEILIPLLM